MPILDFLKKKDGDDSVAPVQPVAPKTQSGVYSGIGSTPSGGQPYSGIGSPSGGGQPYSGIGSPSPKPTPSISTPSSMTNPTQPLTPQSSSGARNDVGPALQSSSGARSDVGTPSAEKPA